MVFKVTNPETIEKIRLRRKKQRMARHADLRRRLEEASCDARKRGRDDIYSEMLVEMNKGISYLETLAEINKGIPCFKCIRAEIGVSTITCLCSFAPGVVARCSARGTEPRWGFVSGCEDRRGCVHFKCVEEAEKVLWSRRQWHARHPGVMGFSNDEAILDVYWWRF